MFLPTHLVMFIFVQEQLWTLQSRPNLLPGAVAGTLQHPPPQFGHYRRYHQTSLTFPSISVILQCRGPSLITACFSLSKGLALAFSRSNDALLLLLPLQNAELVTVRAQNYDVSFSVQCIFVCCCCLVSKKLHFPFSVFRFLPVFATSEASRLRKRGSRCDFFLLDALKKTQRVIYMGSVESSSTFSVNEIRARRIALTRTGDELAIDSRTPKKYKDRAPKRMDHGRLIASQGHRGTEQRLKIRKEKDPRS